MPSARDAQGRDDGNSAGRRVRRIIIQFDPF